MSFSLKIGVAISLLIGIALLFTFSHPPIDVIQRGFRGTGIDTIYNPRTVAAEVVDNRVPVSLPYIANGGPPSAKVYKNVKVLGNVSVGEFTRLMASITQWVAPKAGCAYCHDIKNMASDDLYTKIVARRMLQMVQNLNANWKDHVAATGVTCYTCHRGQPVPAYIWFKDSGPETAGGFTESNLGKNHPAIGLASLPYDPFTSFLGGDAQIRVQSPTALPEDDHQSIKQTEWTYALMMHFSQALGVNCSYCHNTRAFSSWEQSSPQRVTAWYGIRMVRDINANYLGSLQSVFPHGRLGPTGDVAKVNCATCHQGVYKPLFGVSMANTFPELNTTETTAKP